MVGRAANSGDGGGVGALGWHKIFRLKMPHIYSQTGIIFRFSSIFSHTNHLQLGKIF